MRLSYVCLVILTICALCSLLIEIDYLAERFFSRALPSAFMAYLQDDQETLDPPDMWYLGCQKELKLVEQFDDQFGPRGDPVNSMVFLKTHKTGSSTVQNILLRYGEEQNLTFVLPKSGNHVTKFAVPPRALRPCESEAKFDIFCLHTTIRPEDIQSYVPGSAKWFTILRNPDHAFESIYNYYELRKVFGKTFQQFLENPPTSLRERLWHTNAPLGVNQMMRDLGLHWTLMGNMAKINAHLDMLDIVYDLFMITEFMDESLILLRHLMNWSLLDILSFAANQRDKKSDHPLEQLTEKQKQNLHSLNLADHMLYDRFYEDFKQKLESFGSSRMNAELDALRCLRRNAADVCKVQEFPASYLPPSYKPYGNSKGYYPMLDKSASGELHHKCDRLTFSELAFIDEIRLKQRLRFSACHKDTQKNNPGFLNIGQP